MVARLTGETPCFWAGCGRMQSGDQSKAADVVAAVLKLGWGIWW
jgi:hypothetical protein